MKTIHIIYALLVLTLAGTTLASCSDADYTDTIPANSTAIIAISPKDIQNATSPFASIIRQFGDDNVSLLSALDTTKDVFMFETVDGTLGMCATPNKESDLDNILETLKGKGIADNFTELDGTDFFTLSDSWVAGSNGSAIMVMGPVLPSDRSRTVRRITSYMKQDETSGIKASPLWQHLQELHGTTRMTAQANALPQQMVAALTIGAPKGTDPRDVLIEADITSQDSTIFLTGTTCSYNVNVRQSLQKSAEIYRPLTVNWNELMKPNSVIGIFMNVNGCQFMPLLQNNKALNTMLLGTDAYDRIRDNKDNLAILMTSQPGKTDSYATTVSNLPAGTYTCKERLVVVLDLSSFHNPIVDQLRSLLSGTKRIVYIRH